MDDDDEPGLEGGPSWGLVMPFVVCVSKGGPYEDDAFAAGYACGILDEQLRGANLTVDMTVRTALLPQLDLIAMMRGSRMELGEGDDEWTCVRFLPGASE